MGVEFSAWTPLAIRRRARRARLQLPATILAAGAEVEVRIRDLSRTGALGEAARPPAEGSLVVLGCGSIIAPADVAWVVGKRFGLEFHEPVSAEAIAMLTGNKRIA